MSHYPESPQSVGKVLDSGFGLYRKILKPLLPLSFVVALLGQLPQLGPYLLPASASPGSGLAMAAGIFVLLVAWLVIYMALFNGWLQSMDALAREKPGLSVGQALRSGLPKVLSVLGAFLLFGLALVVGAVLLVVPALILMISLFYFWFFIVLEDKGAVESLKASHRLVWGNWWRTTAVFTVGGTVYIVAYFLVAGIAGAVLGVSAIGGPSPEEAAEGIQTALIVFLIVQIALTAVLAPMWNAIMLVQFRDLQLRKSGADLAARAAAV